MMTWWRENWRLYRIRCEIWSEINGIVNVTSFWVSSWDRGLLVPYLSKINKIFLVAKTVRLVMSPLPLPHFYFFGLLFTSHLSPLSERLEQATAMVRFIYPWCSASALRARSSANKFLTLFKFLEFSLRTWKLIGHSTLGWFSKRTGTSVDNRACKSNNWLDQWQSGKLGTGSRV